MSPTTAEVTAAHAERIRRERRHYTPDRLVGACTVCGNKLVDVLASDWTHPACDPETIALRREHGL